MTQEFIRGSIAPTFTAWTGNGEFDPEGQRQLLDYLVEQGGIHCFFVRAGMGQMFSFDMDEAKALARVACEHLAGRAPVIVGCNGIWSRDLSARPDARTFIAQSMELSLHAEQCGANGVVHTVPEALTPEENETIEDLIVRFAKEICAAVKVPVIFYQPPNTHQDYHLTPQIVQRLAKIEGMAGAKVSYSDAKYLFDLIRAAKGTDFELIPGDERSWYAGLFAGAHAVIGQGTILNPHVLNAVQQRFEAGDIEGACEAQEDVNLLCAHCRNPQDFLARRVRESGRAVTTCLRAAKGNLYLGAAAPLDDEEYARFKGLLEEMNEKDTAVAGVKMESILQMAVEAKLRSQLRSQAGAWERGANLAVAGV